MGLLIGRAVNYQTFRNELLALFHSHTFFTWKLPAHVQAGTARAQTQEALPGTRSPKRDLDRHFQKFSTSRAQTRDKEWHPNTTEQETCTEHQAKVGHSEFENLHMRFPGWCRQIANSNLHSR